MARALEIFRTEMLRVMTLGGWASVRTLERNILERITPDGPRLLPLRSAPAATTPAGAAD